MNTESTHQLDAKTLFDLIKSVTPTWHQMRGRYVLRESEFANSDVLVIAPYCMLPGVVLIRPAILKMLRDAAVAEAGVDALFCAISDRDLAALIGWHAEINEKKR